MSGAAGVSKLLAYLLVYAPFVPMALVACVFIEHVLTPRNVVLLRVLQAAALLEMVTPLGDDTTLLAIVILGVVLPLTCYKGRREERALVSALVVTAVAVSEILAISFWKIVSDGASIGSVATSWEHYPAHVASSLLGAVVLGVVLRAFFRQLPDVLACLRERRWALPAFLVTQSVALITLSVAIVLGTAGSSSLVWACSGLCALSLVADVEVFRAAGRLRVRQEDLRRARLYEQYVERIAVRTRDEVDAMAEVAMLRHDLRSHVAVLRALLASGEVCEAQRYAREVARGCAGAQKRPGEGITRE